jgi:hypothetical protein
VCARACVRARVRERERELKERIHVFFVAGSMEVLFFNDFLVLNLLKYQNIENFFMGVFRK